MFVHNVRYGFATNSSSTHSIVLLNKGEKIRDSDDSTEYGWDFFICASEAAKRQYLGQTAKHCLARVHNLSYQDAAIIASNWAGVEVDPDGYIDHQSLITIPSSTSWNERGLSRPFFDDLLAFVLRDDIAILGGNDNEEHRHPLIEDGRAKNLAPYWSDEEIDSPALRLMRENDSEYLRARYDTAGKFWSLFSTRSGTKIRTSFVEDTNADKSEVPELVDIKITDYCKKGCYYCYQGSTPKGKHASKDLIRSVAYALKDLKTFEVALGGGEPTEHPDLLEIIDDFNHMGIVANLTTRNEKWIIYNLPRIKDKIGAIGFSVDGSQELVDKLSRLRAAIPNLNYDLGMKLTVQVIVGSCSQIDLKYILEICRTFHVTVLLLGWKNTHRGAKGARYDDVDLEKLLNSFWGVSEENHTPWNGPNISFDTTLVNQMKDWLEANANKWNFTTREGAHSMYIDCISETMHRSSYEGDPGVPLITARTDSVDNLQTHIKNYFATI